MQPQVESLQKGPRILGLCGLVSFALMNARCRLSVGVVALLALVGSATAVGNIRGPDIFGSRSRQSDPERELRERCAKADATRSTSVLAGDSTTINDWTVVTPPLLLFQSRQCGRDVQSLLERRRRQLLHRPGRQHQAPGGLFQDVTTTPGVQYSLSFWSAVNGDEKPGKKHTMDVSVNGVGTRHGQSGERRPPASTGCRTRRPSPLHLRPARSSSTTPRRTASTRDPRSTTCHSSPCPTSSPLVR